MYIAIIGAGVSGLITLKQSLDAGHCCDVFEQMGQVGGTWNYTDLTDFDEYGIPVHSAMYSNLRTNFPKEIMTFLNFPYKNVERSFISQKDVLEYINLYADTYSLKKYVQFHKLIKEVRPIEGERWTLTVLDAKTKVATSIDYDAVFVCNGHHCEPFVPEIPGSDAFKGSQMHSKTYRTPKPFDGKIVLVVGAGYSGQDICSKISSVAKQVFITRVKENIVERGPNVTEKDEVVGLNEESAVFSDGSEEKIDVVLYCTGYKYSFPFLSEECGIESTGKYAYPLYKHVVNARKPTMFFIGIPFRAAIFGLFDAQVRFALAIMVNQNLLPSSKDMLSDINNQLNRLTELGHSHKLLHQIGNASDQIAYLNSLTRMAKIEKFPTVFSKISEDVFKGFRNENIYYNIINDEEFEKYVLDK